MVWRRLHDAVVFVRWQYLGFTLLLPLIGARTVRADLWLTDVLALWGIALAYHIFAYVFNDVIDLPVDRHSPQRQTSPLVRGTLSPRMAFAVAWAMLPVALVVAWFVSGSAHTLGVVGVAFALMAVYDIWGKRMAYPWQTDVIQGISWGALVLCGAFAFTTTPAPASWLAAIIAAVVVILINGVHASLRDLPNDLACSARTTPIVMGARPLTAARLVLPRPYQFYALTLQAAIALLVVVFALIHGSPPLHAALLCLSSGALTVSLGYILTRTEWATIYNLSVLHTFGLFCLLVMLPLHRFTEAGAGYFAFTPLFALLTSGWLWERLVGWRPPVVPAAADPS